MVLAASLCENPNNFDTCNIFLTQDNGVQLLIMTDTPAPGVAGMAKIRLTVAVMKHM